ncbi:hypothetical protein BGZ46_002034 [Entomortierella lignicola]|nr:hypothetical protein BGZ46_002034 [Entomortierella lignicola]
MHTSLFAREQPVAPLAITKIEGMEKLRQTILGLEVVTPLSINEYLSPDEEQFTVHYEFSDAKLLVGPIFTEEDAEEDIESEEDESPEPSNSEEQVSSAIRDLRAKQDSIRLELEASRKQTALMQFFGVQK